MKKIALVLIAVLLVLGFSTCTNIQASAPSIVGKWGLSGVQVYEFTSAGKFITGSSSSVTISYDYTASGGAGEYWMESYPSAKVSFTYTVTSTTLDMTMTSMTFHLTRM